jgi:hypothetical protein
MAQRRSIGAGLHIGEIDDDELIIILESKLPRSAQFRPGEVEYRTMSDDSVLTLKYQDGKIVDAEAWRAMTTDLEREICTEVDAALSQGDAAICRWTMFSGRPVEGTWRYRDDFQIVPAPLEAPRPGHLWGAEHPFLVDFVFKNSTDQRIQRLRYARKAADLLLVLNLLLNTRITAPTNRARKHWVWAPQGSAILTIWASEGYIIPNLVYIVDDFLDVDASLLELIPADRYHSREGYTDTLAAPAELTELLDAFGALTADDRERFLRACYWHHTASTVWPYSQSLHLTSLVNSIECLSSVGPTRHTPEGPRDMFSAFMRRFAPRRHSSADSGLGPTALFKSLMRKFAPGAPSGKMLDSIYKTRSNITHGERLLHLDAGPPPASLSQNAAIDREVGDSAVVLCRGALINWLWNQRPAASGELLLTHGVPSAKSAKAGTKSGVTIIAPGS